MDIQTAGSEILTGKPGSFYVFLGSEYGIKAKYIQTLKDHYGDFKESDSMMSLISMFSTRHLVPLKPMVYIVRYDDQFISELNDGLVNRIRGLKIIGTIVCVYESEKVATKCGKFLGDWSVEFTPVARQYIKKYLQSDFKDIPDALIDFAVQTCSSYVQAHHVCQCLNTVKQQAAKEQPASLSHLFGIESEATELQLQAGIASRNFAYLMSIIMSFEDNYDGVIYAILNTMSTLERLMIEPYVDSPLRRYIKGWSIESVYNMFMNTYEALKASRSMSSVDVEDLVIYLFALLQYAKIPDVESMRGGFH